MKTISGSIKRPAVWIRLLWAALILAVGLTVRLLYAFGLSETVAHAPYFFAPRLPAQPTEIEVLRTGASLSDSHAYEKIATNLLDHGVYSWQEEPTYRASTYVPPGYPAFIAAMYGLLGRNPWNVVIIQFALSLFLIGFCFFWCEHRWGLKVAVPAASLLALDPVSIVFSPVIMGEVLGASLFMIAIILFLECLKKARWWKILAAGLLLGVTVLVRAAVLYLVILLIIPLLLHRDFRFPKRLALIGLLLAGFIVPVGGWMVRNRVVTGRLHFASITGYNLLYTNAASLVAWQEKISLTEARTQISSRFAVELKEAGSDPVVLSRRDAELGKEIIMSHPLRYTALHAAGGVTTLFATRSEDALSVILRKGASGGQAPFRVLFSRGPVKALQVMAERGWISAFSILEVLALLACYVFCIIGLFRNRWRPDWLSVFLVVAYTAALVGPVADSRFRIAIMPFTYIFAVRGFFSLKKNRG